LVGVSASPSIGGTVSGGGQFAAGTSDTVTAAANSGYTFDYWINGGQLSVFSSSASNTFTVNANLKLVAYFSLTGTAVMTAPVPGSFLPGTTVTFNWSSGSGVTQYFFYVGTTAGSNNLYGQSQGINRSVTVSGLPTGNAILYMRLWSLIAGVWKYNDYTYRTSCIC
jgi:hypothetical protein